MKKMTIVVVRLSVKSSLELGTNVPTDEFEDSSDEGEGFVSD